MADRRRQVELLVATRFDHLWFPRSGAFKATGKTKTGKRPSRFKPCERCGGYEVWRNGIRVTRVSGSGRVRDRFGRELDCDTCKGKGNVPWDEYTNEQVTTDESEPELSDLIRRDTKRVKCPDCQDLSGKPTGQVKGRQCRRCNGTGEAPVAGSWLSAPRSEREMDPAPAPLESSIDRRDQLGDWHALEKALSLIHRQVNKPLKFAALTVYAKQATDLLDEVNLHETRAYTDLTSFERELYDLAITFITGLMPDPIRVPADAIANRKIRAHRPVWPKGAALTKLERERRDKQIRTWAREGKAYTWIGQQAGLSDRQVREIINGKREAAA